MFFNLPKLVVTTIPYKQAEKFVSILLSKKLIACASIQKEGISIYNWKNKTVKEKEATILIKTSSKKIRKLKKAFHEHHPYDIPEFITQKIKGEKRYIDWIIKETSND
jgi:periplasmic divalent cation tolerance protein